MPPIGEVIRVITRAGWKSGLSFLTVQAIEGDSVVCKDGQTHQRISRADVRKSYGGNWWVF